MRSSTSARSATSVRQVIAAAIVATFLFSAWPSPASAAPALEIAPSSGIPGATLTARGTGFPANIDVVRGSYIACKHSLFMGLGSGDVLNAHFRSGRTDGTDPLCTQFAASPACTGDAPGVTMASVTCQRWNASADRWE